MLVVSAPQVLVDGTLVGPAFVVVEDGLVIDVADAPPRLDAERVRLDEGILTAGMVDLQVNGFAGVDFFEAAPPRWVEASTAIARTGVTSFLATFVTHPPEQLAEGLRRAAHGMAPTPGAARILGVHLEGPFLSPRRHGAHDPSLMSHPDAAGLGTILAEAAGVVRVMTLAPELPGAIEAIERLTDAGIVVSLGHSDATAQQARAGVDAGARLVTHLFNAQHPLGHREPGLPGLALDDERLTLGLIADLHHVAPEVVRLVFRAAGRRVALVTDAIDATGRPPGRYQLGGHPVLVGADGLPRTTDGGLAGSTLTLDQAVRNVVALGVEPTLALGAATHVPAAVLGRSDLGRIAAGSAADLVWWSEELSVRRVWVGGVSAE